MLGPKTSNGDQRKTEFYWSEKDVLLPEQVGGAEKILIEGGEEDGFLLMWLDMARLDVTVHSS